MGNPYPAFASYISSIDTQAVPVWQIATLAAMRFAGREPTVELYVTLRDALDLAVETGDPAQYQPEVGDPPGRSPAP